MLDRPPFLFVTAVGTYCILPVYYGALFWFLYFNTHTFSYIPKKKKKKKIIDEILLVDFFKLLTYRDEDATQTRALLNLLVW